MQPAIIDGESSRVPVLNDADAAPIRSTTAFLCSGQPAVAGALTHFPTAREQAGTDGSAKFSARTDASLAAISIPRGVGLSPGGGRTATHAPRAAPDCASGAGRRPDDHGKAETAHPGVECETHPSRTTWCTTSRAAVDPPEYQNAANPRFEASLDAHALAYALEHTNFFGGFMAPQGAKSARQGTQGCACAPRTGSAFRCETHHFPRSGYDLVRSTPFPARRSFARGVRALAALERDDRPTICECGPRCLPVSGGNKTADVKQTPREAFHTSHTGIVRLPSTMCSVRWMTGRRESVCTCYRAAPNAERNEGLPCVRRGVAVDAGSDATRVPTAHRTGCHAGSVRERSIPTLSAESSPPR